MLANHEAFLDHMLVDWEFSGPKRGVGARARARANTPGSQDWTEFEIVAAEPNRIVEEGVSANGKRRTRGTYLLEELPAGRTRVCFEARVARGIAARTPLPSADARIRTPPQRQGDAPPRQAAHSPQ